MAHCNQERIVDAGVLDITHETGKEGTHDVQVAEVLHQVTLLCEEVEVASEFHDLCQVMVGILLVRRILDAVDQGDKILVSN